MTFKIITLFLIIFTLPLPAQGTDPLSVLTPANAHHAVLLAQWRIPDVRIEGFSFSPDSRFMAISTDSFETDNKLWWVELATGEIELIGESSETFYPISFTPDGKYLVTGGGRLRFWDTTTRQQSFSLPGSSSGVLSVSPDSKLITTGSRIWDLQAAQLISDNSIDGFNTATFSGFAPALTDTGDYILYGNDIWTLTYEGSTIQRRLHHTFGIDSFGPVAVGFQEGKVVLASSNSMFEASSGLEIRVWDAASGTQFLKLDGHDVPTGTLAFSPDGSLLASVTSWQEKANTAGIWDAHTGQFLLPIRFNADSIYRPAGFSPDGRMLALLTANDTIGIYGVPAPAQVGVTTGGSFEGTLDAATPFEVPLDLQAGDRIRLTAQATSGTLDVVLSLLDNTGNVLARNDDHGTNDLSLTYKDALIADFAIQSSQTYILQVAAKADTGGDFILSVAAQKSSESAAPSIGLASALSSSDSGLQLAGKIVYESGDIASGAPAQLALLDLETGKSTPLNINLSPVGDPHWNPAGDCLLFSAAPQVQIDLYTVCLNDPEHVQLVVDSPANDLMGRWSPDGSQIVFASDRDGNFELYRMDSTGENLQRLTTNSVFDLTPVWSPDGQSIVFASERTGKILLYSMDVRGMNLQALTPDFTSAISPSWSPDGTRIAFIGQMGNETNHLYLLNVEDGAFEMLTSGYVNYSNPNWSDDGRYLVVTKNEVDTLNLWVFDTVSGASLPLTDDDQSGSGDWYGAVPPEVPVTIQPPSLTIPTVPAYDGEQFLVDGGLWLTGETVSGEINSQHSNVWIFTAAAGDEIRIIPEMIDAGSATIGDATLYSPSGEILYEWYIDDEDFIEVEADATGNYKLLLWDEYSTVTYRLVLNP